MFFQREYIRENVSMTLNETYREDLPEHGFLSALLVKIEGDQVTNYGQNGGDWRIVDKISKIEIMLNGATICKSLAGISLQACAFYDQLVSSPDNWRNYAANTQRAFFLLNFGRYLFDPLYGLDLSKFANVEIKITNTASSTTDFSNLSVSIMAVYLRESAAGLSGYLRTEEWRKWTTVQDETKYLDIPSEHVLRRIILQAIPDLDGDNVAETGIQSLMNDIELTLDTGQVKVYKGGIDDLLRWNHFEYKTPLFTGGLAYMNVDKGINMGVGHTFMEAHGAATKDGAVASGIATLEADRNDMTQKPEAYVADEPIPLIVAGVGYHNTAVFRFDQDSSPDSWLDPAKRKTVELNIHTRDLAAAADGTNRVILDRLVKY